MVDGSGSHALSFTAPSLYDRHDLVFIEGPPKGLLRADGKHPDGKMDAVLTRNFTVTEAVAVCVRELEGSADEEAGHGRMKVFSIIIFFT